MEKGDLSPDFSIAALSREEALICLMKEYGEEIKRLVYTFVKNWTQAEDITQDVFITIYTKLDSFQKKSAIRSWIYSIAINKSKDYLKSWQYRKLQLSDKITGVTFSEKNNVEVRVITHSEDQILYQAVLQLPLKYREVILLHYYKGFLVRETSEFLSLNEATVKTRLSRGRKLLHEKYVKLGGER